MKVFYDDRYVAAGYEFDTTRKAKLVAERIGKFVELTSPDTDGISALIRDVHDHRYIDALETGTPKQLAESQGFEWDAGLWESVLASTAGMVEATRTAIKESTVAGSLSSGMHHAKYSKGDGFCSVNGLVVAALEAIRLGFKVTILDLDAHSGGGTDELLRVLHLHEVQHLDLTVSPFDGYQGTRFENDANLSLGEGDAKYLAAVRFLLDLVRTDDRRVMIYNAGMDPYPMISRDALYERERMVAEFVVGIGMPTVFGLAGGYAWSQSAVEAAGMHVHTVAQFAAELTLQGKAVSSSNA